MALSKYNLADASLILLTLFYIILLGGGNYEQLNVTNLVCSAPPKSLYILQGPYGFKPMFFWVIFRPITILLFVFSLVVNWKYSLIRRNIILGAFLLDVIITIATFTYFAPQTAVIAGAQYDPSLTDQAQFQQAQLWKNLNWVRLGGFYAGGLLLLVALTFKREFKQ